MTRYKNCVDFFIPCPYHINLHHKFPYSNNKLRLIMQDLSRTHGNTIISLPFFEICIGFQFVKESSSNWRPWSTNVSMVCVHPTLWSAAPAICWQIGTACSKNTNCDIWPAGFHGGRPGVWNSLPPALREPTLSFNCFRRGLKTFCSDSCNCFIAPLLCFLH